MSRGRRRLSAGAPTGCRIVVLPVGLTLASITAFMVWIAVDQTRRLLTGDDFGVGTVLAFILLLAILGVVIYAVGFLTLVYLRLARTKVWLKGPLLVERGIVLRRRIDLRTARVELRVTPEEVTLTATDQRSGRSLDLPIQSGWATLPASELTALAQAILDDSGPVRRTADDRAAAVIVADRLRSAALVTRPAETPSGATVHESGDDR